jgi:hypothetical protein
MRRPSRASSTGAAVGAQKPPKALFKDPVKPFVDAGPVEQVVSAEASSPNLPGNMDPTIAPVVNLLRAAGLDKEVASIEIEPPSPGSLVLYRLPLSLWGQEFPSGALCAPSGPRGRFFSLKKALGLLQRASDGLVIFPPSYTKAPTRQTAPS